MADYNQAQQDMEIDPLHILAAVASAERKVPVFMRKAPKTMPRCPVSTDPNKPPLRRVLTFDDCYDNPPCQPQDLDDVNMGLEPFARETDFDDNIMALRASPEPKGDTEHESAVNNWLKNNLPNNEQPQDQEPPKVNALKRKLDSDQDKGASKKSKKSPTMAKISYFK